MILRQKTAILAILLAFLAFAGCEQVIDVELDEGPPLLAVDSWITNKAEPCVVKLSKTGPYFKEEDLPRVSGALVQLTDAQAQLTETLQEVEPGKYTTNAMQGQIGHDYTLTIQYEGETYRAETSIKRTPKIDSLVSKFRKKSFNYLEGYYLLFYGSEPKGVGDYYRFIMYRNDTMLDKPENLFCISDITFDGNTIAGVELHPRPFKKGDKVRVEMLSLTKDAYYFFTELDRQIRNVSIFSNQPSNVRTNVKNVNPDSPKQAVGYFGGSGVVTQKKQIE